MQMGIFRNCNMEPPIMTYRGKYPNASIGLIQSIDRLHTTELGYARIKRNLGLTCPNSEVVDWCKSQILKPEAEISASGKNWYVEIHYPQPAVITINKYSLTIITAHKGKQ